MVRVRKMPAQEAADPLTSKTAYVDAKLYVDAKSCLHVSAVPGTLPCREDEFRMLHDQLYGNLEAGTGCTIYVSGVPGGGKTATVREVVRQLQQLAHDGVWQIDSYLLMIKELPGFMHVEMNGMKLTDATHAYQVLWQQINGNKLAASQAQTALETYFNSGKAKKMCLAIMDELDQLVNRKQTVMYNFFNWPNLRHSKLIVVAIANTMDLPERMLANKISSRLGLTRVNFQPYTYQQLAVIIKSRLADNPLFEEPAIQLCARKVSAVSGDARRALDLCRRAVEVCESKSLPRVTIGVIQEVIQEMLSTAGVLAVQTSSLHQKIFINSILEQFRASGLNETTFADVATKHVHFCRLHNLEPPSISELSSICANLYATRLIILEQGIADFYQKITLNLTQEEVRKALTDDEEFARYLLTQK